MFLLQVHNHFFFRAECNSVEDIIKNDLVNPCIKNPDSAGCDPQCEVELDGECDLKRDFLGIADALESTGAFGAGCGLATMDQSKLCHTAGVEYGPTCGGYVYYIPKWFCFRQCQGISKHAQIEA